MDKDWKRTKIVILQLVTPKIYRDEFAIERAELQMNLSTDSISISVFELLLHSTILPH